MSSSAAVLPENSRDNKTTVAIIWKALLISGAIIYLAFAISTTNDPILAAGNYFWGRQGKAINFTNSATTIDHLLFGIVGSEKEWNHRKAVVESWWRPNETRGYVFLDKPPKDDLLPWSTASPPYKVSQDITKLLEETNAVAPVMIRMVHGIMEIFREEQHKGFRWLVMGDDDTIFFADNIVQVVSEYDHRKYYYLGGQSEYILSNYWFSFNQGFGGAGFILSYPLVRALANDMDGCLSRYAHFKSADLITMKCIADFGVNLSPQKGFHQMDLHGDISGLLSSHPKSPLLSLHHLDILDPIFPKMDCLESTKHLMEPAKLDQSRMLQQTICHQRQKSWSISVSWGYSVHIYEKIMPRSWLQNPIETFRAWTGSDNNPPRYMLDTRLPIDNDPCETPHVFFFKSIEKVSKNKILTTYYRSNPRGLLVCSINGSHSADLVSEVLVYSPAYKRIQKQNGCNKLCVISSTTICQTWFNLSSSAAVPILPENLYRKATIAIIWKTLLISSAIIYLAFIISTNHQFPKARNYFWGRVKDSNFTKYSPTDIDHLLFGLVGSEKEWHRRKTVVETWWRQNITRGYVFLDKPPKNDLLPWSIASPPYRVSRDQTKFLEETGAVAPVMIRIVHGILEIFREEEHKGFRWLVMGDDDTIFFVDNIVEVLKEYDHTKYYYFGGQSEYILSNYWFSFNQGFGGAGFILSYPLVRAVANDMDGCLRRYAHFKSADHITMKCIADFGVNLSPQKGLHQIDLLGDISGLLSSHPKSPLLSLHHLEFVEPIFPKMDCLESTKHLMKPAKLDQSRMLQQTICHQRQKSWSISVSWGYSVHIYEKIMPRSWLQNPIETFKTWTGFEYHPPHYLLDTRIPINYDPCITPHVFYFKSIKKVSKSQILTTYYRSKPRGLLVCSINGSHSADLVSEVLVYSPANKRILVDRSECCDIGYKDGRNTIRVKLRECLVDEIIA